MKSLIFTIAAAVALTAAAPAPSMAQGKPDKPGNAAAQKKKENARGPAARAQGQGQGQGQQGQARGQGQQQGQQGQARGQGQGRGQGQAAQARTRNGGGPPAHARARMGGPAPDVATYNRDLFSRAAEARTRRNGQGKGVRVQRNDGEVRVTRDDGTLLFRLDAAQADRLGYWRMAVAPMAGAAARPTDGGGIFDRIDDDEARGNGGSPAFCRSGEGHPVWGREWCVDKGFGLGDRDGGLWGRATDLDGVVLRAPRTTTRELDRGGLIDVLGDIVFGRLAVQSLVLGADQPLTGRWIGETDGPRVLRVRSGDLEVAELVDADRDDRVDVLLVNLGD